MKKRIHINQHNIRHNAKNPADLKPVVSVKTYKENVLGYQVEVDGPTRLVYSPDKPLSCGAKVWLEAEGEVRVCHDTWGEAWEVVA